MDLKKNDHEKKSFTEDRYVSVCGFLIHKRYEKLKDQFDTLEINEDDTWICTFPKCGTTWTQEMVWLIGNNLDYEKAKVILEKRSPTLDLMILHRGRNITTRNSPVVVPSYIEDSISTVNHTKRPRFIKTHFPLKLFPKKIQEGKVKPKIVYVARDPKDVCVSYYHHYKLHGERGMTFEEFCELFLAGKGFKMSYGPFWNHVLPFWKMRNLPNVLFLKYEDMKNDLRKVINQVSEFLERPLTDDDVERLTEHLSFESMRKNPAVTHDEVINFFQNVRESYHNGKFMRKGVVGDHKLVMSSEIIKKFDDWTKSNTDGTDYVI